METSCWLEELEPRMDERRHYSASPKTPFLHWTFLDPLSCFPGGANEAKVGKAAPSFLVLLSVCF